MKSVTLVVIFTGLLTYWNGVFPTEAAASTPTYNPSWIHISPMSSDPDDDEDETRVNPPRSRRNNKC